jgi:cardiolipin synthase
VSELGKILDPVADRLLFFVAVGGIMIDGSVPAWFALAVLAREVLVAGGTLILAAMGVRRIDVTWFGKAYTLLLMIAFPLFLASESTVSWHEAAGTVAMLVGIPGLVLSWYSAALYLPIARRALRERSAPMGVKT